MKFIITSFLIVLTGLGMAANAQESLTPEEEQLIAEMTQAWDSVTPQTGDVTLADGIATLHVPDEFVYFSPQDSETVLVNLWGNVPGAGTGTLGMLFPADLTPFDDDAWAVTVEYTEDGYVSDEGAEDIDYSDLLSQMKSETRDASAERVKQGYEPISLVGWASEPYYDQSAHILHWAKEIKFGDQDVNTLNYDIRVLGRKGVLVLSFIASMAQKDVIDSQIDSVLSVAEFNQGSRYQDFDPDLDEVAAYGLGALVAGKLAAKAGLFAIILVFLKKFGVFIVVGVGALVSKLFKRKKAA